MVSAMYRASLPLTHRPERDGTVIDMVHVPAYLAFEFASYAWGIALFESSGGTVTAGNMMVVHVDADFGRELLTGFADVEVVLSKLGRSSLTLDVSIHQNSVQAASMSFTLVRVEDGASQALSDTEIESLESLKP